MKSIHTLLFDRFLALLLRKHDRRLEEETFMVMQPLRSPLKWLGGKFHSAPRIVAAFPPLHCYSTYLEPCGGAAHVLLCKPQGGHREIYNDLNDDLCNFWDQLQNNADALVERLQVLPYSRKLYYDYHLRLFNGSELDPLERAVLWFYVLRGTATGWIRESPVGDHLITCFTPLGSPNWQRSDTQTG
jgi:site-specific DNA-adenine methylase